ncbi:MAG: DUF2891 domain-containing protein [Micropruina glycogenica]
MTLLELAPEFVRTIVGAVRREYPNAPRHVMTGPHDTGTPAQLHPAFYGCFDWHSAVEMHWALLVLLPDLPEAARTEAETVLDEHLTAENLAVEAAYLREQAGFERPYGWGWALALADAAEGTRWARALAPLAAVVTDGFIEWLPRSSLPNRQGTHANTAFALARSWPWAQRLATHGEPALVEAIASASKRWYGNDRDYPVEWEPGGNDFLSPALAEAELMGLVLAPDAFRLWVEIALPDLLGGRIGSLSRPVTGIDTTDGQAAHLHGLNLHRAACLRALQRRLGDSVVLERAAQAHLDAALPVVSGSDWMAEHWLAAYAVLALRA